MSFDDTAKAELAKPLDKKHVKPPPKGKRGDYVEGWHVIAEANRIFGFDGWTRETVSMIETNRELLDLTGDRGSYQQWRVGYVAKVRVSAGGISREGTGFGSGMSNPAALGEAIESAVKEAETDAMKRALMTFGNPFGLALYDKTQANVSDDRQPQQPAAKPPTGPGVSAATFAARIDTANTFNALEAIRADLQNTDESVISQQQFDALWADIDHKAKGMTKPNGKSPQSSLDALDHALGGTAN